MKSEREEMSYGIPCIRNLKRHDTGKLIYKTETDSDLENELKVDRERTYGCRGEGWKEKKVREFGIIMYNCYTQNG